MQNFGLDPRGRARGLVGTIPSVDARARDVARRVAVVFGAVLQVAAAGDEVARISAENRSLVVPAGYAFAIWGPIFGLVLAYAIYQALPANRARPIMRRTGWLLAATCTLNGVWEIVFPTRSFALAQVIIVAGLALSVLAYLRVVRDGPAGGRDPWLVALPVGLLSGWLTAATAVSFATTFVALGLPPRAWVAALSGAALLLLAGLLAAGLVRAGRAGGPATAWGAYAFAVLWAFVAVVVNQYDDSVVTTAAAVAASVPVAVALVRRPRETSRRAALAS
jgi:hypothetical protein